MIAGAAEPRRQVQPRVSVIVPVYNKAPYLRACLDSILGQSLSEIELICINDASTDASAEILENYARKDERIAVVNNPRNLGPGPSRNKGIDAARADFLQFTDADDLLFPGALETLYQRAQRDGVGLVRGMIGRFFSEAPDRYEVEFSIPDRSRFRPLEDSRFWIPWWHTSYLMSARLIRDTGIRYPDLRQGEDPVFLASLLVRVSSMSTVGVVTYNYRRGPLSQKGRATAAHLTDYLKHAAMVKEIFAAHPQCWLDGYGPEAYKSVLWFIDQCTLTEDEKSAVRAEMDRIWDI